MFQDNKNQGKDALKFAKTFKLSIKHLDNTKIGHQSDWYPLGIILERNGKRLSDYDNNIPEAIKAATYLSKKNAKDTGYEFKEPVLDDEYPEFSKFFFVFSMGKEETHNSSTEKMLDGSCDLNSLQKLEMAKGFLEGIGFNETGDSKVEIENVKMTELKKEVELIKLT